ncbi:MAG TPA: class I SAM-dependent methyltransferase, partial [Afifellaceae bacterium]|nr:class I SAM-dependent methyltransferase [Afifellaceae bacterium]
MTTPLGEKLKAVIAANGPLGIADYMHHCLADPEHGYYTTRDPLGSAGDFTTAPEISQMFGELIGAWLVHAWRMTGAPAPAILAEAGPGRGTLMADILRAANSDPAFISAISVHLVETSPALRDRQQATLSGVTAPVTWHERIEDVPEGPLFFSANEFFDALPIQQYVRGGGEWRERVVGLSDGNLAFDIGARRLDLPVPNKSADAPDGTIFEVRPAAAAIMDVIASRIATSGGAALIVDYGYFEASLGDTLQAVSNHAFADPLAEPGEADLTAHVDFAALARSIRQAGAAVHGPMDQGAFLIANGLLERAGRLGAGKDAQTRDAIGKAVERLAGPGAMGSLFKVLAVTPAGLVLPP